MKPKGGFPMPLPILTAAQMKACDEHTIRELCVSSDTLMYRAAHAACVYLYRHHDVFPPRGRDMAA